MPGYLFLFLMGGIKINAVRKTTFLPTYWDTV